MSTVLFSIYMSNPGVTEKIKQSLGTVRTFQQAVFGECAASEARIKNLNSELTDAKEHLRSRRTALASVRREILRQLHESGGVFSGAPASGNAPPLYMREPETGTRTLDTSQAGAERLGHPRVEPPKYEVPAPSSFRSFPVEPVTPSSSRLPSSPPMTHPVASSSSVTKEQLYAPPPGPPPNHARSVARAPIDGVGGFVDPRALAMRSRSHSPSPSSSSPRFAQQSLNMPVPTVSSSLPPATADSSSQSFAPLRRPSSAEPHYDKIRTIPESGQLTPSPIPPSPSHIAASQDASSVAPLPSASRNPFLSGTSVPGGNEASLMQLSYEDNPESTSSRPGGSLTSHNPFRSLPDHQLSHPDSKIS